MRKCFYCKKPLKKPIWRQSKFCSQLCFQADKSRKHSTITHCKTCGKEQKLADSQMKIKGRGTYCSKECREKGKRYSTQCEICGGKIMYRLSEKRKYCSRICTAKGRKGTKNGRWKGGVTPKENLLRSHDKYHQWQQAIFKRDNWTCQKCFKRGGKLEAHHNTISFADLINNNPNPFDIYDDYFYQIDNGLTLCNPCHRTITFQ